MSVAAAIREAASRLDATSDTARLDAELLMAHALGCSRSAMLIGRMGDPVPEAFAALVARRAGEEPVAHITGSQDFYGLPLRVTRDTLIPRGDSETLIEAARDVFAGRLPPARILDMGTGSGALLLAALTVFPEAEGVGIDASPAALAVASANAEALSLAARARFFERNWNNPGWADDLGRFDLVLCNPPYVEAGATLDRSVAAFEPAGALFAGDDGLDDYRRIVPQLGKLLLPGGVAILEIGATQGAAVCALLRESGLEAGLRRDLAGRDRAVVCR